MQKVHIIFWKYDTTTAGFQRDWAFAKGLAESGLKVECDFMMPNNSKSEKEPIGIHCNYWGDDFANRGKIFALVASTFKAIRTLRKEKSILSFMPLFIMACVALFSNKKNLYIENDEYPPLISHVERFGGKFRLNLYNWVCKISAGVFVISNKLREYFVSVGVDHSKIYIINMIVDSNRFNNINKQDCEPYICYCGTVSNRKDGVNVLLESFGMIANDIPDIKLYILGSCPYQKDNEINDAIIKKYKIRDRVYMPGAVPGCQMPQYLKNAKVVVLSRPKNIQAEYGFPTKLGEYLMTGNPVVVTRVGELDDFLEHGKSCLFAEPGNADDFAEKMKWVLDHPDEAMHIGANGKEVAEISFNYKIEGEKIADVIIKDSKKI